jgi:hypothetical protein
MGVVSLAKRVRIVHRRIDSKLRILWVPARGKTPDPGGFLAIWPTVR